MTRAEAKLALLTMALAATLGGWAALADQEAGPSPAGAAPEQVANAAPAGQAVAAPGSAATRQARPIARTRSSR